MITYKNYSKKINIQNMTEANKILYTAYYLYKSNNDKYFSIDDINETLKTEGIHISNLYRAAKQLKESKNYKKIIDKKYTLTSKAINLLDKEIDFLNDVDIIEESGELLDKNIFCGFRKYLDKLILQANHCYENNCFDACATMLRRILETLLIDSYEHLKIEQDIKDTNGDYFMLEKICNDAKTNSKLGLTRVKNKLDSLRDLGNYASHRRYYNTFKSDIDNCKNDYRVIIEELMYKSGIK